MTSTEEVRIEYQVSRKRFGRPYAFRDFPAQTLAVVPSRSPLPDVRLQYERASEFDASPRLCSTNEATVTPARCSAGVQHREGGWAATVQHQGARDAMRSASIAALGSRFKGVRDQVQQAVLAVRQNAVLDIFEEYFADSGDEGSGDEDHDGDDAAAVGADSRGAVASDRARSGLRFQSLGFVEDPQADSGREVSAASWRGMGRGSVVVAFADPTMRRGGRMPWEGVHLHSYEFTLVPSGTRRTGSLLPTSQLTAVACSPLEAPVTLTGEAEGTLALFDSRGGELPVQVSQSQNSHLDAVADVAWLDSRPGIECASVSQDGMMHLWDVRRLASPLESARLHSAELAERVQHTTDEIAHLSLDATRIVSLAGAVLVGTAQGVLLQSRLVGARHRAQAVAEFVEHAGPVEGLTRTPVIPRFAVSVADWHLAVWNVDRGALCHRSASHPNLFSAAAWVPGTGVVVTGDVSGRVHGWDLETVPDTASFEATPPSGHPSDGAVTCLAACPDAGRGAIAAAGFGSGRMWLLRVDGADDSAVGEPLVAPSGELVAPADQRAMEALERASLLAEQYEEALDHGASESSDEGGSESGGEGTDDEVIAREAEEIEAMWDRAMAEEDEG